jgi:hypothetical protein
MSVLPSLPICGREGPIPLIALDASSPVPWLAKFADARPNVANLVTETATITLSADSFLAWYAVVFAAIN